MNISNILRKILSTAYPKAISNLEENIDPSQYDRVYNEICMTERFIGYLSNHTSFAEWTLTIKEHVYLTKLIIQYINNSKNNEQAEELMKQFSDLGIDVWKEGISNE